MSDCKYRGDSLHCQSFEHVDDDKCSACASVWTERSWMAGKRKGDKAASASKRDVPTQLEPLDHKPTPKEGFDLVQLSKVGVHTIGSKPRPS